MKITTLQDAADYQADLIRKIEKSGRATMNDIYMSRYVLEIIEARIVDSLKLQEMKPL